MIIDIYGCFSEYIAKLTHKEIARLLAWPLLCHKKISILLF